MSHKTKWLLGIIAVLLIAVGIFLWYYLFRTVPEKQYGSLRDHFLYGSIGTEGLEGTPYWIWVILPKVFPEYLPGPGGYASLGLNWEPGHELPMGVTTKTIGYRRTGLNCAFCHVSQVRRTADQAQPDFYPGGPSHQFRVGDYQQFLFRSAADPRFNATVLMHEIESITNLSPGEKFVYRFLLIPGTKKALLKQRDEFEWQKTRPPQGPGRVDPFNPVRFRIFKQPDDGSVGNADIPSIWNQADRVGTSIHWDGLSKKFAEVAISSAIGDGARDQYLDTASLNRVGEFVHDLKAPAYPLPIDHALAARGEPIYKAQCGACHALGGARTGTVVPMAEGGTDHHRADSWTQGQVDAWKKMAADYKSKYDATWNLDTFAKNNGYVTNLLDGVWLRGPYLHNGSVPNLRALLEPEANRPRTFYRGNDVVDPKNVGFISDVPYANGRGFFFYDTSLPGNGNQGHLWGTTLSPADKEALLEYMKTL